MRRGQVGCKALLETSYNPCAPVTADNETFPSEVVPDDRRAFTASEMVQCPGCSRANPPNRSNCLYCGYGLGIDPQSSQALAPVSTSQASQPEQGSLTHILIKHRELAEPALANLAQVSGLTIRELEVLLAASDDAMPVCAVDVSRADLMRQRLVSAGVEILTVDDEQLNLDLEPKDLRGLESTEHSLIALSRRGGQRIEVSWNDVMLIVVGRLHVTTVEIEQKKSGGRKRVLGEREIATDEALMDIYIQNDEAGWRVRSNSFDFSCLGKTKSITTFANFSALTDFFRRGAVNAEVDDAYNRLRSIFAKMWPAEEPEGKTERRRAGARNFHAMITTTDNLKQFTRYSRLRRFLTQSNLPQV